MEISSKIKSYVILLTNIGWFHFLLLTPFFKTFSYECQIYVAEVLIIHFCNYYHQRLSSPCEYQSGIELGGVNLIQIWLQILIWVVLQIQLWSNLCLTWSHCGEGQLQSWIHIHLLPLESKLGVASSVV